ncbi:MAG: hypothetical protein A2Z83_08855 [Omnitrophica bacterium GWA2_52_8]|nr:MAG: hypothetical protein A2Z83_08855 [Omnitrophica bacterium GWA2_52_8]
MHIRLEFCAKSIRQTERAILKGGKAFLDAHFTAREHHYCGSKKMKFEHYAVRLAAKQAFLKLVGSLHPERHRISLTKTSRARRFPYREVEIFRTGFGNPEIRYSGRIKRHLAAAGKFRFEVSLAHERRQAVAAVVMINSPG